eukprot:552656-Lingulodinium_polyedra.AAC.1
MPLWAISHALPPAQPPDEQLSCDSGHPEELPHLGIAWSPSLSKLISLGSRAPQCLPGQVHQQGLHSVGLPLKQDPCLHTTEQGAQCPAAEDRPLHDEGSSG